MDMNFKSILLFTTLLLPQLTFSQNMNSQPNARYSYLALGDSYTIGEGVEEAGRYPNQTVELLKTAGIDFESPMIIAKTGWTTNELKEGISKANISGKTFDLVTLLIGVNNQYRGRDIENYKEEFRQLLEQSIAFAKGKANKVVVVSIPDWGITPFAKDRNSDQEKVKGEIDHFNKVNQEITLEMGGFYIEITERYREIGSLPQMLVEDRLHPSPLVYQEWAELLSSLIIDRMNF
jgi:lysophospholipase L1-like esterase